MKLDHIRNATTILSLGPHTLLVDPMLSDVGAMAGFKMLGGGRQRNPLVALPPKTFERLEEVTAVVLTHEHPDHFDPSGLAWAPGQVLFNHLEALDHCATTREFLRDRMNREGLGKRIHIPEDGQCLHFDASGQPESFATKGKDRDKEPGFQKWLTAKLARANQ